MFVTKTDLLSSTEQHWNNVIVWLLFLFFKLVTHFLPEASPVSSWLVYNCFLAEKKIDLPILRKCLFEINHWEVDCDFTKCPNNTSIQVQCKFYSDNEFIK